MRDNQQFLQNLYDAFNKREIETIISLMKPAALCGLVVCLMLKY